MLLSCSYEPGCQQMICMNLITWSGLIIMLILQMEEEWKISTEVYLPVVGSTVSRGVVEDWVQIQSVQVNLKMSQLGQFLHNFFSNSIAAIRRIEALLLYAYKTCIQCHFYLLGKLGMVTSLRKIKYKTWKEWRINVLNYQLCTNNEPRHFLFS